MSEAVNAAQMEEASLDETGDPICPSLDEPPEDSVSKPDSKPLVIKWLGKEIQIADVTDFKTVGDLKQHIHEKTGVQVARQKLLNLQFKGKILQLALS